MKRWYYGSKITLKNDNGNLKEMTSSEVDQIVDQVVYQYSLNPSVSLSVVSSGGNLGTISDTRLQARCMSTIVSSSIWGYYSRNFCCNVNYQKVNQSIASVSPTTDTGTTFLLFIIQVEIFRQWVYKM